MRHATSSEEPRPGRFWHARSRALVAALLSAILALGCDASTVTQAPGSPGSSSAAGESLPPGESAAPGATGDVGPPVGNDEGEPEVPPLPRPSLTDAFSIGDALYDPSRMGDAVVSLLALMGIGIYAEDGTVVQHGNERAAGDPWLFESEVWELINMGVEDLLAGADDGLEYGLADLYEALGESLPGTSLDGFIEAYESSFAAHPDHLAPSALLGQPIDATTRLTRPQLWLLFMDGFVDLAEPASVRLEAGALLAQAAGSPPFGTANANLPSIGPPQSLTPDEWAELRPHFMTIAATIPFFVNASSAHEGHGGQGTAITIRAVLRKGRPFVSPLTGAILLRPYVGPLDGLRVSWTSPDVAVYNEHGTLAAAIPGQGVTDAAGFATIPYTPKREAANGQGSIANESANIAASAKLVDLVQRAYRIDEGSIVQFLTTGRIRGTRKAEDFTVLSWHTAGIHVRIVNTYDVTVGAEIGGLVARAHRAGRDELVGTLVRGSDGKYRGTFIGQSAAAAQMEFATALVGERCEDNTDSTQLIDVVGELKPAAIDTGLDVLATGAFGPQDLMLSFYPGSAPQSLGRCQGSLQYIGPGPNNRPMTGAYIAFNDSHFTTPSLGFRVHVPTTGDLEYEDWRLIEENLPPGTGVDSLFTITIKRDKGS